jgi:hypothetical protein
MSTLKDLKKVMKHFRQALKTKNIKLAKTDTECWETDICIAASLDGTVNNNVYTIILFEDRMDVVLDLCVTEKEIFSQETDYSDLDNLTEKLLNLNF